MTYQSSLGRPCVATKEGGQSAATLHSRAGMFSTYHIPLRISVKKKSCAALSNALGPLE